MPGSTHYTTADAHVDRFGNVRAVCGQRVNELAHQVDVQAPTCERCQQWLSQRESEPLPSWAREAAPRLR